MKLTNIVSFRDTITFVELDPNGNTIFIGGSCKAKDLRRNKNAS